MFIRICSPAYIPQSANGEYDVAFIHRLTFNGLERMTQWATESETGEIEKSKTS